MKKKAVIPDFSSKKPQKAGVAMKADGKVHQTSPKANVKVQAGKPRSGGRRGS